MDVRYKKGRLQHFDQNDGQWYDVGSGDFAMSQNYDINATDLVIPGCVEYVKDRLYDTGCMNYGTYGSTSGYKYSFYYNSDYREFFEGREVIRPSLRHVTLEEGVKQIGFKSFYGQSKLDRIDFPESLEWVHMKAFEGTKWFDSQPYGPVYCGNVLYAYKFYTMSRDYNDTDTVYPFTKEIIVKEGTKSISSGAFDISSNYDRGKILGITRITLPRSLIGIGDYAFRYIRSNFSINIPDSVTWIGVGAFKNTNVNIDKLPPYLWVIQDDTFYGATGLERVNIPKHTKSIGYNAFRGTDVSHLTFDSESELIEICTSAFSECENLESVILPEGLKTLGACFSNNTKLKTVYIPSSLTSMSSTTFSGCSNLENVTIGNNFNTNLYLSSSNSTKYSTETLEAIIDNLADRVGLKTGYLVIGSSNRSKLSTSKIAEATAKNWSVT